MPIKQELDHYLITVKVEPPSKLAKENYDLYLETARNMRDTVLSDIREVVEEEVDWEAKYWYKTSDGNWEETLFDALVHELGYEEEFDEFYIIRVKDNELSRPFVITVHSFRELIETAYLNPDEFELLSANPKLTPKQEEFLQKVIQLGMEELIMKKLTK